MYLSHDTLSISCRADSMLLQTQAHTKELQLSCSSCPNCMASRYNWYVLVEHHNCGEVRATHIHLLKQEAHTLSITLFNKV